MTAQRAQAIKPFYVMELMQHARAAEQRGIDVVHMEVGEPDFDTPETIVSAAHAALDTKPGHYTLARGLPELREAIAAHYAEHQGLQIDPGRILVTPGASGALQLILGAVLDPGDELLLTDPGYPCNRHLSMLLGAQSRAVAVTADNRYQPTAEQVTAAWQPQTRALLLASPANPTGSLLSEDQLSALYAAVKGRGHLIVDEIYHGLVYGQEARSALHQGDDVFVVNSFSKYYGMTGWRVGWLVAPESHVPALERLAQNLFIAPSTLGQHAALAALSTETRPELERRRLEFQKRRDYLLQALRELGFVIRCEPAGAFYIYADASHFTNDSYVFSLTLLEEAGVVVTPGIDFGEQGASTHLRFSYTTSMERLQEGVARLRKFLSGLKAG